MSASKLRIYHRLQLAAHKVQKVADRELLEAAGVTTAQAAVLTVLAAEGPATQREVAQQLGLNESAMTAMIGRLLRLGLLERERDAVDPRAWRLLLNDRGRSVLTEVEGRFRRINGSLDGVLSPPEIAALADYLQRIRLAFDT
jgi:MarR family transcriptional regulator, organic hydroperoxide resistance regulator